MSRREFLIGAAALAAAIAAPGVGAQAYPTRPVRLLVGFPPGGSTDLAARVLAEKLGQSLGQPVVVENRPGASGNIAAEQVARSAPDGYTLLMAATSFATSPSFFEKLPWDPTKDFTPIALVATVPILVVTHPSVAAKTPQELVAYSKANPGRLNLASPGAQTLTSLSGELFKQISGLDWTTVHYRGGAPAVQDLLAGTAHVMFANISDVIQHVKAGSLNAIAVTTPQRSAVVPQVPTLAESGFKDFSFSTWQAVLGPAGMPAELVARLNSELTRIAQQPDTKERFLSFGTDTATSTPAELGRFIAEEVAKIRRVAQAAGALPK
ncbi:MAG TPA: tripartite tricarboxylate transporter substrate binding protein [Burkholderiaceae bacterium]|nr:tripartite tricarboxylate transporter substrate binding protein [Burkholderiaceae bacterium]